MSRERARPASTEDPLAPGLEELLSLTAHELHEPLRKIATFGELLKQHAGPALDAESLDYLERMQRATERMRTTLDCVLAFARVPRGLPFVTLDLAEVVASALEKLSPRIAAAGAAVDVGALPLIEGDPFQMQEVFEQLLDNALKFRREGVPPVVRIDSGSGPHHGQTCHLVRVADNGQGFENTYAERIFRPFERLHGRGKYSGAGMGLSICREIVQRHGARIEAYGTPDDGAVFTIAVPAPAGKPLLAPIT
jgi:light-regulated signal transduction histidine kinase (bacteriophytochrome)